jgi:hypothetical protein
VKWVCRTEVEERKHTFSIARQEAALETDVQVVAIVTVYEVCKL